MKNTVIHEATILLSSEEEEGQGDNNPTVFTDFVGHQLYALVLHELKHTAQSKT